MDCNRRLSFALRGWNLRNDSTDKAFMIPYQQLKEKRNHRFAFSLGEQIQNDAGAYGFTAACF